ncbi:MAG: bifunctional (p)ppGpp synthetase/guanosine-3',5'-bis(diphosphate) 3'-pyrophosphohydrolase [Thiohalomonadales bacterium]
MFLIDDLCTLLEGEYSEEQIQNVSRAYAFGAEAHKDQTRVSGEPYIYHPLAVARILAEMRMDVNSIIAAILHDVIEDTGTAKEHLTAEFGIEIADLVDGVSKLTQVKFETRIEAQAENFQKMILAMVQDIRVILIKLADRMHNMRTLGVMPPEKIRRIAKETLEIYVPIAHRLGMNTFRLELEDLGFRSLYPMRAKILESAVLKARGNRKEILDKITATIQERMSEEGLDAPVSGREKHLYSVYEKMKTKRLSFSEVFDMYAFRIIVDRPDTCYRVLGIVHHLFKPVPGKFKDYIAIPKANGYQSLHTILFGPFGVLIEVQIRTEDMEKVANEGIAAHWLYKTGDSNPRYSPAQEWVRGLAEMQLNAGDSLEFLESVKIDLFPDEVYVFSPQGEIKTLPRGSTIVDFAYAVHTDLGNSCVAGKIDRHLAPLRTELLNGQTVEIISSPGAKPNPVWLDFVVSAKARGNIRHFLKQLKRDEAVALGRRMLDKALASFSANIEDLSSKRSQEILDHYKISEFDNLLEQISLGNHTPMLIAQQFCSTDIKLSGLPRHSGIRRAFNRYAPGWMRGQQRMPPLHIRGTEGSVVSYARCCKPIPGDPILGFLSVGRGIVIHVENCKNVREFRNRPEKWVDVKWSTGQDAVFLVDIRVDTVNRRGVLATVAATIADQGANIEAVNIEDRDSKYSSMTFTITVIDRKHLANIIRRVRIIEHVAKITRNRN